MTTNGGPHRTRIAIVYHFFAHYRAAVFESLAAIDGLQLPDSIQLLQELSKAFDRSDVMVVGDEETLMHDIFSSHMPYGASTTLASHLHNVIDRNAHATKSDEVLQSCGLRIDWDGVPTLLVAPRMIANSVLTRSKWNGKKLSQFLLRLPGAENTERRVNHQKKCCVAIPLDVISKTFLAVGGGGPPDSSSF